MISYHDHTAKTKGVILFVNIDKKRKEKNASHYFLLVELGRRAAADVDFEAPVKLNGLGDPGDTRPAMPSSAKVGTVRATTNTPQNSNIKNTTTSHLEST
jgi:hypothetical protein